MRLDIYACVCWVMSGPARHVYSVCPLYLQYLLCLHDDDISSDSNGGSSDSNSDDGSAFSPSVFHQSEPVLTAPYQLDAVEVTPCHSNPS